VSVTAIVDKLVVRRTIAASPKDLFDAWLDPGALMVWMKPAQATKSDVTVDARVGGRFEIVMHTQQQVRYRTAVSTK
jgi:uncharacterized protein YndB with AHSA1/START domain